jgi:NADH-quinone oxidoreductase subunit K
MLAVIVPTTTGTYLLLSAVLFGIGAFGLLVRRNPLDHVHVRRADAQRGQPHLRRTGDPLGDINGQTAVFFVMVVAAAEVVVGLGIIVSILRRRPGATADDLAEA